MVRLSDLREKREAILKVAERHGARHLRIFGSVARNEEKPTSDVDLLVRMDPERSLLDRAGLMQELRDLLGCEIDVVNEKGLPASLTERVRREAIDL
jgi:uncharacterized protein